MHIWGVSASLPASSSQSVRLHNTLCRCSDVLHSVALRRTALHSRALHSTVLHRTTQCTALDRPAEQSTPAASLRCTTHHYSASPQARETGAQPLRSTTRPQHALGEAGPPSCGIWSISGQLCALTRFCGVERFVLCRKFCAVQGVLCCARSFVL